MKKTVFKISPGLGLLLLVFSLWNCQEQDNSLIMETGEKKVQAISFNAFKNEITPNKSFTSISKYFDIHQYSEKIAGDSEFSGNHIILTDKIIKVSKEEGASYTFRLLSPKAGSEFYNLVVEVDDNGNIQKSVMLGYIPSEHWLEETSRPFSGHVKVLHNAVFSGDDIFNPGDAAKTEVCYEVVYEWECNAGNNHEPNTCTAGGSDLVITYFEVSCPYEGSGGGDGVSFPVGEESSSGPGGGGSGGGSDPGADSGMTSPVGPDTIEDDCNIALSINIDCNTLLIFEQDYKNRMSVTEKQIYESLSRIKQLSYLANAQFATWKAEELFPNWEDQYNGKGDAFRHAYWNAANVNDLGYTLTENLTTAHEDKPPSYTYSNKEQQMDLFNNQVGRDRWNWPLDGYNSLEESILDAVNSGALRYLNNLDPIDNKATNLSQLIPTNQ